jgi:REP element-mobilizing transposase RayT
MREFNEDHTPIAYLITFRTYGTWMHGDERGSIDRDHRGYGTPALPPSPRREEIERSLLQQSAVLLNGVQRPVVERAIRETCQVRNWNLWTLNVRTNHVHCVISAHYNGKRVTSALKANATRMMREAGCWQRELSPWARGGSVRYVWTEEDLVKAFQYVKYGQGKPLT